LKVPKLTARREGHRIWEAVAAPVGASFPPKPLSPKDIGRLMPSGRWGIPFANTAFGSAQVYLR